MRSEDEGSPFFVQGSKIPGHEGTAVIRRTVCVGLIQEKVEPPVYLIEVAFDFEQSVLEVNKPLGNLVDRSRCLETRLVQRSSAERPLHLLCA